MLRPEAIAFQKRRSYEELDLKGLSAYVFDGGRSRFRLLRGRHDKGARDLCAVRVLLWVRASARLRGVSLEFWVFGSRLGCESSSRLVYGLSSGVWQRSATMLKHRHFEHHFEYAKPVLVQVLKDSTEFPSGTMQCCDVCSDLLQLLLLWPALIICGKQWLRGRSPSEPQAVQHTIAEKLECKGQCSK